MNNTKKPRRIIDFDVVFHDNGDLAYRNYTYMGSTAKTEKNHVFSDTLEYIGYSGNHIRFKSINSERNYHMFISDFDEALQAKRLIDNQLIGSFCFTRKGLVQGIRLILEP